MKILLSFDKSESIESWKMETYFFCLIKIINRGNYQMTNVLLDHLQNKSNYKNLMSCRFNNTYKHPEIRYSYMPRDIYYYIIPKAYTNKLFETLIQRLIDAGANKKIGNRVLFRLHYPRIASTIYYFKNSF